MKKSLSRFHKIISRFKDSRILVLGDIMLDKFIWGTVSRISPEAPVPVVWSRSESFMPGGASNVANSIRVLGAEVYMAGTVGDDEAGRILAAELAKNGIDNEGIVIDSSRPTTDKMRIIAHHQQVVRVDKESSGPVGKGVLNKIISFAKKKIPEVDAVILEDYGKGLMVPRLIKELVKFSKAHKKIIMIDPKEEHVDLYRGITAITPNRNEAEEAAGIKIRDVASLKKVGKRLLQKWSSEAVLITLGEDGMALFQKKGGFMHIPTVAQQVYDVSGAGDTVIGVFALAKASGAGLIEAAHISNVAAGVVVGKLGIASCTQKELKAHLGQVQRYGTKPKKSSYPSDSIFA
ncbi:MAG: D-glycero-beta-D-manno-heptose-7-phosphate kinase [Candidatus Omnitrophica bacterium]|nr:D-glycero-beta-D-manno-heptose-7-phosphate kinase [Candidatus Omnitrophota bacterium]